jgi:hypothetical protein
VYINILKPFNKGLKYFGMRLNFEVRPRAVAHLALAQGHLWIRSRLQLAIRSKLQQSGQISTDPVTSPPIRSNLHRSGHISTDPPIRSQPRERGAEQRKKKGRERRAEHKRN